MENPCKRRKVCDSPMYIYGRRVVNESQLIQAKMTDLHLQLQNSLNYLNSDIETLTLQLAGLSLCD
jgi:hypothetical protein